MRGRRETGEPKAATRRKVLPPEVREKALMDAAAKLFVEKGIEATTIIDIVNEASAGKGTFYHYFSSKEEVILALREKFSKDFVSGVAMAIEECPTTDHAAQFHAWLRATIDAYASNYRLHDVVFHEFRHSNRNAADKEIVLQQLMELLEAGVEARSWRLSSVRATAIVLFDGMHGVVDDAIDSGQMEAADIYSQLSEPLARVLSLKV
jgi:AcrR family transcriptional regulator